MPPTFADPGMAGDGNWSFGATAGSLSADADHTGNENGKGMKLLSDPGSGGVRANGSGVNAAAVAIGNGSSWALVFYAVAINPGTQQANDPDSVLKVYIGTKAAFLPLVAQFKPGEVGEFDSYVVPFVAPGSGIFVRWEIGGDTDGDGWYVDDASFGIVASPTKAYVTTAPMNLQGTVPAAFPKGPVQSGQRIVVPLGADGLPADPDASRIIANGSFQEE
jgi:hypothetical protein